MQIAFVFKAPFLEDFKLYLLWQVSWLVLVLSRLPIPINRHSGNGVCQNVA